MRHLFRYYTPPVTVTRPAQTTVGPDGQPTLSNPQQLTTDPLGEKCLIEGLRGGARNTIIGRIPGASYTFSFPPDRQFRDGDLVHYRGREFHLRDVLDDTTREGGIQYYTGILQERRK